MANALKSIATELTTDRSEEQKQQVADLLASYPVPPGWLDEVLNRTELAKHLDTTEPTVDRWINDGIPVYQTGSNGRSYKFLTSEVRAWMLARKEAAVAAEKRKALAVRQLKMELLGGNASKHAEADYTPKQCREIYELDALYREVAIARGELVPRRQIDTLLEGLMDIVRKSINGMPDRLARDAGLTGRQEEEAVTIADDVLQQLHDRLTDFAEKHKNEELELLAAEQR